MATLGKDENRSSTTELLPEVPKAVVQPDFTLNHYDHEHVRSNFDLNFPGSGNATGRGQSPYIQISGNPSNGDTLILTDTQQVTATFEVDTSVDTVDGSVNGSGNVIVGVSSHLGNNPDIAEAISNAINNQTLIKMSAGFAAAGPLGLLLLRQKIQGPAGNTSFTNGISNTSIVGGSPTVFSGGFTHGQAPFSKRFQLVRPVAESGLAMSRNGIKIQG